MRADHEEEALKKKVSSTHNQYGGVHDSLTSLSRVWLWVRWASFGTLDGVAARTL